MEQGRALLIGAVVLGGLMAVCCGVGVVGSALWMLSPRADAPVEQAARTAPAPEEEEGDPQLELERALAAPTAEEALMSLDRALYLDPGMVEAWFQRGVVLDELGQTAQAREALEWTLELAPDHQDARRTLGWIALKTEDHQACVDLWTELLHALPEDGEAWYARARCYEGLGKLRHARAGAQRGCTYAELNACAMVERLDEGG